MRRILLVLLSLAAASGTAAAQSGGGLTLNLHAFATPGFAIKGPDIGGQIKTSLGPGIGAQVGYAFTDRYMLFVNVDLARLGASADQSGHWGFGMVEIGGRMNFPTSNRRLSPYVAASFGGRGIGAEVEGTGGDVKFGGLAFSGGGGLAYELSPSLALDGGVMLSLGKFGDYEDPFQEGDLSVDNTVTTRIRFGLNWRP
jgi:hypothetical protein